MSDDLLEAVREHFSYEPATGHLVRRVKCGKWPAGQRVGAVDGKGHRQVRFRGKLYLEHRLIWFIVHGQWPTEIDHINRVRDDNRLCNLRDCSHRENNRNNSIRADSATGHRGVSFYPRCHKFVAYITVDGKRRHLGYFPTVDEAAVARRAAERKYFGEFAP